MRTATLRTCIFSILCAASALIALASPSSANNCAACWPRVYGHLGHDLGAILVGGGGLLVFNWLLIGSAPGNASLFEHP